LKKLFIEYNDLPTDFLCDYCYNLKNRDDYNYSTIFMHVREPDEINKLKLMFKLEGIEVITLLVDKDVGKLGNYSDDDVSDYKYDYYIDNNGTIEQLKETVETFINEEF
jgi:hypothetical protein